MRCTRLAVISILCTVLFGCTANQTKTPSDRATNSEVNAASNVDEIKQFNEAVDAYWRIQSQNRNRVIRYTDDAGKYAKSALDPQRAERIAIALPNEINSFARLRAAMNKFKPVVKLYGKAFHAFPGKYDQEFMDAYYISYILMTSSIESLQGLKLNDPSIDAQTRSLLQSSVKMLAAMPRVLNSAFEKAIKEKKFSAKYESKAKQQLVYFQRKASAIEAQMMKSYN